MKEYLQRIHRSVYLLAGLALFTGLAIYGLAQAADFHTHGSDEPMLPDLVVNAVTFEPDTGYPVVVIKNTGRASAGAARKQRAFKVKYSWTSEYNESQKVEAWVPTLARNAKYTLKFPASAAFRLRPLNRSTNLVIEVDSTNRIKEEFDNNNTWSGDIPKPDLVIGTVTYNPGTQNLTVFVENQGQVRVGRKYEVGVAKLSHWWLDENGDEVGNKLTERVSSIEANGMQKVEWTVGNRNYEGKPDGAVKLSIKVDTDNRVMEEDETNNAWEGPISDEEYSIPCSSNMDTEECILEEEEDVIDTSVPTEEENTQTQPASQPQDYESGQETAPTQTTPTTTTPAQDQQSSSQGGTQQQPEGGSAGSSSSGGSSGTGAGGGTEGTAQADTRWQSSADLIVLEGSVRFVPVPATVGTDIKFWGTVQNVGTGPTGQLTQPNVGRTGDGDSDTYLYIDLNSDGTWDVTKTTYTPPLYQEHIALKSFGMWKAVRGTHKYKICADGEDYVRETNETNNCVEKTITVQ